MAEPAVRPYLEEARRCVAAKAHNAALVMAWNALSRYLRLVVEAISVRLFIYNYKILRKGDNPPAELGLVSDKWLIQICHRMGILRDVDFVEGLRKWRNDCAHPNDLFASPEVAGRYVSGVYKYVSRQLASERLTQPPIIKEFIKQETNVHEGRSIAKWIQEDHCPNLAHSLLDIFLRGDDVEDVSGIVGLWQGLWDRIDDNQKSHLWVHLENATRDALQHTEGGLRTPKELYDFIVWPSRDEEHQARDRIGRLYIEWLRGLVDENAFESADIDLARQLRERLPESMAEELRAILQDMIRRYAE
jgi:hypothetical protein